MEIRTGAGAHNVLMLCFVLSNREQIALPQQPLGVGLVSQVASSPRSTLMAGNEHGKFVPAWLGAWLANVNLEELL